jgi:spermidine/putrescine ABC transporter ATP-binding subunit
VVTLRGLQKRYGDVVAVADLNLEIKAGEFITLLGSSGSGKTTTLLMVAGFEQPTSGSIVVDGRDMTYVAPHKREIGMVFQNYALFPHMTVFDNVAFPLTMRGIKGHDARREVARALELVHLTGYEGRYTRELSGGQQQRVAVARATVYGPPLLLMDEPLSALDRKLRASMQLEIKRIHRDLGTSVIYVTHDQEEALALSNRIVLMHDGHVEQTDTPRQIYERPKSAFVASFLGESNFLRGVALELGNEGDVVPVELENGLRVPATATVGIAGGSQVFVCIRPEHMHVERERRDGDQGRSIEVRVDESIYLGDVIRSRGTFETGEACTLRLPAYEYASGFGEGTVFVEWRPEEAIVVPRDPAA